MKIYIKLKISFFAFIAFIGQGWAQSSSPHLEANSLTAEEIASYEEKVKQLVSFLEFSLNTIGEEKTSARAKETIINESYLKAFASDKVQIEDDLDENRDVPSNKDVQAYLKDVDYFFTDVQFTFDIRDITHFVNEKGKFIFKVTLNRNLQGITIGHDTVNNNKTRYIEVNLNDEEKDLKIASIYTTKLSEKEELTTWWNGLSYAWKNILQEKIGASGADSADFALIKRMASIEKLDLSHNTLITDLEPVVKLRRLREINVSNTQINSLIPLRNLTRLEILQCSRTPVLSLEPLKYSLNLREIICDNTFISDLAPLRNFKKLEKLDFHKTSVYDLSPLEDLHNLKDLKISNTHVKDLTSLETLKELVLLDFSDTRINDLAPLSNLSSLEQVNFENTLVNSLAPLKGLDSLRTVICNNTLISELDPLHDMASLESIYCDNTPITTDEANRFMQANPDVLVINESEDLKTWWEKLSTDWRAVFNQYVPVSDTLAKEDLAKIANLSAIDISGHQYIMTLDPLRRLRNLKELNFSNTQVSSLDPLSELVYLQELKLSNTRVSSLEPLQNLRNLKQLNIDNIPVKEEVIEHFAAENRDVLVVYRSAALQAWWKGLPEEWKQVLRKNYAMSESPANEQLHDMIRIDSLSIIDSYGINTLAPIHEFSMLKALFISNTQIRDLEPVQELQLLEVLICTKTPVSDLEPIAGLTALRVLNIESTPVEDLEPVENLTNLEVLRCSGTQVDDLKPLENLVNLRELDCFNTDVKKLKPLKNLTKLESLKCYNTRISQRRVDKFRDWHPECRVIYY